MVHDPEDEVTVISANGVEKGILRDNTIVVVSSERCDLECGDRFFNGAAVCRHNRTPWQAVSSENLRIWK